jgi:Lar family restriction alleviation protein
MSAIGKCPWCGGGWTMTTRTSRKNLGSNVACDACGASGPFADTPEAAITAWNRLATPERVTGISDTPFPQPRRKDSEEPCGECHI